MSNNSTIAGAYNGYVLSRENFFGLIAGGIVAFFLVLLVVILSFGAILYFIDIRNDIKRIADKFAHVDATDEESKDEDDEEYENEEVDNEN